MTRVTRASRSLRGQRQAGSGTRRQRRDIDTPVHWQPRPSYRVAGLCALVAVFVALHLGARQARPLWLDEASTFWTTRAAWLALIRQAGTDGSPPLYFLIVKAFTQACGASEFALRLPSLLAAATSIPGLYFLGRRLGGVRVGLAAAILAAFSPLVHYYAADARMYAIVQLETVAVVLAWLRAIEEPRRHRRWLLLWLAELLQLATHVYAAFLLPWLPVLSAVAVGREHRARCVTLTMLTTLGAFAVCSPWLLTSVHVANAGVGDWIAPLWNELPPAMAVVRSLSAFGFATQYPSYLWLPLDAPNIGAWSLALSLVVLCAAILGVRREGHRAMVWATAALLFLPLATAWAYSWLSVPLYLPGRYDTIVLPLFLVLFAVGVDCVWRWQRWAGALVGLTALALAAVGSSATLDPAAVPASLDVTAGRTLARVAAPGDRIIATALRQQVTWYYAMRSGFQGTIQTYPSEVNDHPGWESTTRMLSDPVRLQQDAAKVIRELVDVAREGHRVWILPSGRGPINDFFFPPLFGELQPDPALTFQDAGLVGLRLR